MKLSLALLVTAAASALAVPHYRDPEARKDPQVAAALPDSEMTAAAAASPSSSSSSSSSSAAGAAPASPSASKQQSSSVAIESSTSSVAVNHPATTPSEGSEEDIDTEKDSDPLGEIVGLLSGLPVIGDLLGSLG